MYCYLFESGTVRMMLRFLKKKFSVLNFSYNFFELSSGLSFQTVYWSSQRVLKPRGYNPYTLGRMLKA